MAYNFVYLFLGLHSYIWGGFKLDILIEFGVLDLVRLGLSRFGAVPTGFSPVLAGYGWVRVGLGGFGRIPAGFGWVRADSGWVRVGSGGFGWVRADSGRIRPGSGRFGRVRVVPCLSMYASNNPRNVSNQL